MPTHKVLTVTIAYEGAVYDTVEVRRVKTEDDFRYEALDSDGEACSLDGLIEAAFEWVDMEGGE